MIKYVHKDLIGKSDDIVRKALESFLLRREHINIWDSKTFIEFFQTVLEINYINAEPIIQKNGEENSFEYIGLWQKV